MLNFGPVGYQTQHGIFQEFGIGVIKALVDPQRHEIGLGDDIVPVHGAKVFGAGDCPHHRYMRSRGLVQVQ